MALLLAVITPAGRTRPIALAPSFGLSNVKDFSLTWTLPDLKDVMASAKLVAMNYNPAYMREVFERD